MNTLFTVIAILVLIAAILLTVVVLLQNSGAVGIALAVGACNRIGRQCAFSWLCHVKGKTAQKVQDHCEAIAGIYRTGRECRRVCYGNLERW